VIAEHHLLTPDGRVLQVRESGALNGVPVLVHHGSPGSRLLYPRDVGRAERQGIRLLSYDRPGYGGSTPHEGRTVADCADDVRAIAGWLGMERLAVWGISGGGPHAVACAALLPELVPAVAVLAGSAPWDAPGLDYFAGMGQLNVDDTKLMFEDPAAARAKCESDRLEMLATTPDELFEQLSTLLSPVDAGVFTGDVAEFLVETMRLGLTPGADGWWDDEVAFLAPWGFELDAIRTPVLLCHGRQDRFVPFAHGEWLSRQIPGVEAKLTDDDGHLTLTRRHLDEVHAWLLERVR
jgi:pimeloyl-ACP methyl ester carboxylesterase